MKDGVIGVLGTGGAIFLQEFSVWLSVACGIVTLIHFTLLFKDRYGNKKK